MNILLIGSGGREHALAWAISASPLCDRLFIAPGNPGTAQCGENVVIDVADHKAVVDFCRLQGIEVFRAGEPTPFDRAAASKAMAREDVSLELLLDEGRGHALLMTSDLGYRYVQVNAEYTT